MKNNMPRIFSFTYFGVQVRAARERAVVPLEQRMTKFRQLLEDKKISAFR
jgi:hypothetical protein